MSADKMRDAQGVTIRDLDAISMALAARLTKLHETRIRGNDYLLRDAVMREVVEWRRRWDQNSAARAILAAQAPASDALSDDQIDAGCMALLQCTLTELGDYSINLMESYQDDVRRVYAAIAALKAHS